MVNINNMVDTDSYNYHLSPLVLDMNYDTVWDVIKGLKAEKITNKNCNINSEKFKMLPEIFETIEEKKKKRSKTANKFLKTNSFAKDTNHIYKQKLDYSEHVKNVTIERVNHNEDANLQVVTFKNIKFFKLEDASKKSFFEYDLPNVIINKANLIDSISEEVIDKEEILDIQLLDLLSKQIIPKFDTLYTILNFGSFNPSFKQYFGAIIQSCKDYFNDDSGLIKYDYKRLTTIYQNHYESKDKNNYFEMDIKQPYSSTRIRILSQFQNSYTWPFENPDDCLQFFSKFILEDLQIAMEKYDDPTARTFVSNRFYESLESRLVGLKFSNGKEKDSIDEDEIDNLQKYLNFLKDCNKFKRNKKFNNNDEYVYDPILDFVYCLWGQISNIIPTFLRLSSSCKKSDDEAQSLFDYLSYNLACRTDEIENVSGIKRTLTIALQNYPSSELNINLYNTSQENDVSLPNSDIFSFKMSNVSSFALCLKRLKKNCFTEKFKKQPKELFDPNYHQYFKWSEDGLEYYLINIINDLNRILDSYNEIQFEETAEPDVSLEYFTQWLAKKTFTTINFNNIDHEQRGKLSYWNSFNKNESQLSKIENVMALFSNNSKTKQIAKFPMDDQSNYKTMHSLIQMIQDVKERETSILRKFLYDKDVLLSPIAVEDNQPDILKENRIFLEHINIRPYYYQLVAREFFNSEGTTFEFLKDKILQVILAFADPFGRPIGQQDKIMSIDYLSDLMIGFVFELLSGNVSLNSLEIEHKKMKIAALFTNFIKFSFKQLKMDKLNYDWLQIDKDKTWIEKTKDMFSFEYTTRGIELAYNANILMTYSIWKLTKDLSVCNFTPAAELFAWAWSSCNLNLQVYLKIDQIEEVMGSETSFSTYAFKPWSPYLLKTLTMLSSGWRYVLATILNQKIDDSSIKHEFHHLSFNQFMSPANRKFSSGALSSTSIELLENCLNVMIKRHFIDFNKKDELDLQKQLSDIGPDNDSDHIEKEEEEEDGNNNNSRSNNVVMMDDFFQNKDKRYSYFEKIEIIPDDDLDDDVQYVFKDLFIEEEYYFPFERNVFVDPKHPNKKYFFDYRDPEINPNTHSFGDDDDEEDDDEEEEESENDDESNGKIEKDGRKENGKNNDEYDQNGVKKADFLVCNTISASEEFLYRTEIARCSCSVTKAFIKKREILDLNKQVDPTEDSLIFVDSSPEFCPSELLSLFAPFITYPYLSDNNYDFDRFFIFKPITDINFRNFIERFLSLDDLDTYGKMQTISEIASINFHFNDVFERGVVFTEDEIEENPNVKNVLKTNNNKNGSDSGSDETVYKSIANEMNKFNTRKGFFEQDIDEVKACFNLRGELLQMLLKMDNTLFKYMEKDYYFVERLLDELLMDKFYMCWINCLFTLMKVDTEEEFYNDRYFCLYIFKLISRSVGPLDDDSLFDDCFLVKGQKKFDYLHKSFGENTVLPDMDHAFFYFSFLAERTANFLEKIGDDVSSKILELVTFYTEFFVNQLQGLYLCLLSVSQCGFDLPKNKEFFNVSCLNSKFLLNLSELGCAGSFPFNKKDINSVSDFFKTIDYVHKCVMWLIRNDTNNCSKFEKMEDAVLFIMLEFSFFFEDNKLEFKEDISNKFNEMVIKSQYDFKKHQLGTLMYTEAVKNTILRDTLWRSDISYPLDVLQVYVMFYETSKHFSNMNMNFLITNNIAFKHSIDHGLDLTEKTGNGVNLSNYSNFKSISDGFIYKEEVLNI